MTTKEELPLLAGARAARQRAPLRPPPAHEGARRAQAAAGERPQGPNSIVTFWLKSEIPV